jgi:tubulin polyglutamylase TTLL6/13
LIRKLEDINISERYVVQEYLNDPLLIDGLKFDLRIYVLVLSCNPLKVMIHEDGLTRLATEQYAPPNPANINDMCVHLTNYAVNKNNPKFEFNKDPDIDNIGHKRSLKSTFSYLEKEGKDIALLKSRIEDIILKTLCSIQPSLSHIYKSCQPEDQTSGLCFELLGFDVIIDKNLNPILLEVNHSPSFSTDSPLDYKIKHRIIKETLVILGSRVRDRKQFHQSKKLEPGKKVVKIKETKEEKWEKAREICERREKWEESHMGGFKKLYPAEGKEKYDGFIAAAANLWSEMAGHAKKKEDIVKNTSVPKAVIKPKAANSAPRRPLTLSSTSLQKLVNLVPEGDEEGNEEETIQKMVRNYKVTHNFVDIKEFIYYKHLEEMLRDRRQAISLLRGSDNANKNKALKVSRNKECSQGNYIVPKTFDFSPKIVQPTARNEAYKLSRTKDGINSNV